MGGKIGVKSIDGQGSNFYFDITLPEASEVMFTIEDDQELLYGHKMLIIGEDAANIDVFSQYIQAWEMSTTRITSGTEALKEIQKENSIGEPYSVIMLHEQVLGMNSKELCRTIKDISSSDTKIILVSMSASLSNIEEFQKYGIDGYIIPPIKLDELKSELTQFYCKEKIVKKTPLPTGSNVLIAEDNRVNQMLLDAILCDAGYKTHIANNGKEAIDIIEKNQEIKLVFMDCQMPVMDGYEATGILKRNMAVNKIKTIPIIAITANALQKDKEKCLSAGMDDYIAKPLKQDDIHTMLSTWAA